MKTLEKIYFLLTNPQIISSYVWFFLPSEASLSFSFTLNWIVVKFLFSSTILTIGTIVKYINFSILQAIVTMVTIVIITIIFLVILGLLYNKLSKLKKELNEAKSLIKSQQVKYGKSFEHFVPFIDKFPADRENTIFLGMPLDFIAFEDDSIKFIEVKTGVSQLSNKQKHIKQLVEEKKISWHELRY